MGDTIALAIFVFAFVVVATTFVAFKAYGWKIVWWLIWKPLELLLRLTGRTGFLAVRAIVQSISDNGIKVDDPATAELIERQAINPQRTPKIETLTHGKHFVPGGVVQAVHKGVVGMAGSGKNQTDLNYELQYQLQYSNEHIILMDAKTNAPLTKIVRAYARTGDRVFIYSFHPNDQHSSSLRLFRDPAELADLAFLLTDEPEAKDSHWNEKAGELIAAVATAISEQKLQAEDAAARFSGIEPEQAHEITASLNEVRDIIADRRKLEEMCRISPLVDNVADNEKEWGYIRSTANRRLTALSDMTVRRVVAGGSNTDQPDFTRRDGRDIVIFRPHPRSAKRLARYIFAGLDSVYRAAADAGDAGGPGTKVLIDEAASYMKLDNLSEYMDLGRESKVQLTYVLQGVKQLAEKLGRDKAGHILTATEVLSVGATKDQETARMVSEASAPSTVHYRNPAQTDEIRGKWTEKQRHEIAEHEITGQSEGQWIILLQGERPRKVEISKDHYHYTQVAEPRPIRLWGYVDPAEYAVPPILAPVDESGQEEPSEDDNSDGDSGDKVDTSGKEDDDDEWVI